MFGGYAMPAVPGDFFLRVLTRLHRVVFQSREVVDTFGLGKWLTPWVGVQQIRRTRNLCALRRALLRDSKPLKA